MKKDSQITFRISSDLREQLEALAVADQRTLAAYIVLVLQGHVAKKTKK